MKITENYLRKLIKQQLLTEQVYQEEPLRTLFIDFLYDYCTYGEKNIQKVASIVAKLPTGNLEMIYNETWQAFQRLSKMPNHRGFVSVLNKEFNPSMAITYKKGKLASYGFGNANSNYPYVQLASLQEFANGLYNRLMPYAEKYLQQQNMGQPKYIGSASMSVTPPKQK